MRSLRTHLTHLVYGYATVLVMSDDESHD